MSPMWKYETVIGAITKIQKGGYVVVKWDDVNGEWHYYTETVKEARGD